MENDIKQWKGGDDMYTISDDNNIVLVRGDTLYAKINIFQNGEEYIPIEGDIIRFAMKRRYKDGDDKLLINKIIPNDTLVLKLNPEDTKDLQQGKTYIYDIQLTKVDGDVDTFISGSLTLKEEVY